MSRFQFLCARIRLSVVFAAIVFGLSLPAIADHHVNASAGLTLEGAPLALRGFDPVAYFTMGKPVVGQPAIVAKHDGAVYQFASEENRRAFEKDPARYVPQFGGFCAYGVALGKKLDSEPTAFKIVEGKLYLNLNKDVQAEWSEDISGNVAKAEQQWKRIRSLAPVPASEKSVTSIPVGAGHLSRDNEAWLRELKEAGASREGAVSDLRKKLVSGLIRSLGGYHGVDRGFVEDVVQESILKVLSRIETFEGRSRFETWAMAIAVRSALTELRRRRWAEVSLECLIENAESGGKTVIAPGERPHQAAERQAILEVLRRLIEVELTEKQRVALEAELRGMPQEEIGRKMGSNRNAVYKLTHDARRKLRSALEEAGYTADHVRSAFSD